MNPSTPPRLRSLLHGLLLLALFLGLAAPASAFPIFARKYQTSCVTCHSVYPKLNPFGEAFRLNGYRMPKETEDLIKQKPVSLGSEAYKRVWPDAVWPNELPGNAPVAVNVKMANVYTSSTDASGGKTIVHNDFQFPQEVNLFAAGTLGEHMSFMAELTHAEGPDGGSGTEIEHARLGFESLFGPEHAFNVRMGKFAPNLYAGFQEMWLMTDNGVDSLFNYNPVGFKGGTGVITDGAGIVSLPARVRGIEVYGVLNHRFFYTFGFSNKIGPGSGVATNTGDGSTQGTPGNFGANNHKDIYLRLDYKFGGMGLDGDTEGVQMPPENWREKSFRIGVLALKGNGTNIDFIATDANGPILDPSDNPYHMQDTSYTRTGLFASWTYSDLNVFGVYLSGKDTLETRSADGLTLYATDDRTYKAYFVQADYVLAPPFHLSARYEKLTPGDTTVQPVKVSNYNFTYLAAANLKFMLEYNKSEQAGVGTNKSINTVIRAAF
ncbi:MAG: hypothetical protein HXX12_13575 [Geothrix sp.]|uniref:hypothetical protein n=1 Tax=Geothrix sp. TaxID=1962974 RepID=UPI0017F28D72|nr:hypothetical protein [Geothrix sp.]NWJ41987.1 hypothetical protein [Geothrix sp.]WIL20041.1 MAG: OprO/OprP family phosphate-selective porin [Geothrix sp.]